MIRIIATLLLMMALGSPAHTVSQQADQEFAGLKLSEFPGQGELPTIRMINAGSGDMRELRYRFDAGSSHSMVMGMQMSLAISMDGSNGPSRTMPTTRMPFLIKVLEADAAQARYEFSVPDAPEVVGSEGAPREMVAAMRETLRGLTSLKGSATVSSRGITSGVELTMSQDAEPQLAQTLASMKQSIEQMSVPLPERAVGVGARWQTLQRIQMPGITLYQVSTFSLTQMSGSTVTFDVTIDQFGPAQEMKLPGLPEGTKAELVSSKGKGKGQTTLDMRTPVPQSKVSMESETVTNILADGERHGSVTSLRLEMNVQPGKLQ